MTLVSNGVLLQRYDETPGDLRLGRHLELDAHSLAYTVEELEAKVPIKPQEWMSGLKTLDQARLGSCTGNAGTYHLAQLYGADLSAIKLNGLSLTNYDAVADEKFAVELYSEATTLDGFPGTYPPDDNGSSGLGICRALKAKGLVKGYQWAVTLQGLATMLQKRGCIIGTPWYHAWFQPDVQGFVDSGNWKASGIAGGHEIYIEALEAWNDAQPTLSVIRFRNSWGEGWGDKGAGRMRLATYAALKQQIDVKQYVGL